MNTKNNYWVQIRFQHLEKYHMYPILLRFRQTPKLKYKTNGDFHQSLIHIYTIKSFCFHLIHFTSAIFVIFFGSRIFKNEVFTV